MYKSKIGFYKDNEKHEAMKKDLMKKSPISKAKKSPISKAISKAKGEEKLEKASKKAGWYVHGHKNYGDVYEA